MAFEQAGVAYLDAVNGIARPGADETYVVYRTEKNSPFVAEFLIFRDHTQANPIFLVSADGVNYTELAMNTVRYEDKNRSIWQELGIGEFVRNDRFCCTECPKVVNITIKKTYAVALGE
jgi:hypothetical protein